MSDLQTNLRQVAAFSTSYRQTHLDTNIDPESPDDPFQLRFFLKNAMAGARPASTSAMYREAAETVLREHQQRIEERLDGDDVFPDHEFDKELKQEGLTNGADRQLVIELVDFLAKLDENHEIVDYTVRSIKRGDINVVYDQLIDIHNIAQKKAALFLRDTVTLRELENELSPKEYRYVFPVDTQVRKVVSTLGLVDTNASRNQIIDAVLEVCQPDVSPIAFNQGAWYLGANAFDVLMKNLESLDPPS
jgi:hypothetical protein